MSRYFTIAFEDLAFNAQQEMIDEIKSELEYQYKQEAEEQNEERSWQIVVCDLYDLDSFEDMSDDEAQKSAEFAVDMFLEEEAEKLCSKAFSFGRVEVEVEI